MDKKSKSSKISKRKVWSKSPNSKDTKSKRKKHTSSSSPKDKNKTSLKSTQRKSRWQDSDTTALDTSKSVAIPGIEIKKEKPSPPRKTYRNMKDLLPNKETLVDVLFELVKGESLEKITPDYLKKYSEEDLKKLCLEELKKLSDEAILEIAYPQEKLNNKTEEEKIEKEKNLCVKPDQTSSSKIQEKEETQMLSVSNQKCASPPELTGSVSSDVVELHTTSTDLDSINEETEIPVIIKEEVAKDLILNESDAELLELEMRARVIRSFLKAKNQVVSDEEN